MRNIWDIVVGWVATGESVNNFLYNSKVSTQLVLPFYPIVTYVFKEDLKDKEYNNGN